MYKKKNWFSRQLDRMGSSRSFRSFYSRGSESEAYKHSRNNSNVTDTRLTIPNGSKYSPKSSLYERIMRRPRSPAKHFSHSVPPSDTSTTERKKLQLPLPSQGYDNPVIGRLVLTPVNEMSSSPDISNSRNNYQLNSHNSLFLLKTQGQDIPALLYKTTETQTTNDDVIIKGEQNHSNSETNFSMLSTAFDSTSTSRNETPEKEETNKHEVFV